MNILQKIHDFSLLVKNNKSTLKGFLHLSMVRGTQIIMGLVTTYFLTRALSVEQYGEYQFVLNVFGALSIFGLTEFNNTLMQSTARGFTGSYKKLFPYPIIASLGGSLVLLGFAIWYGIENNHKALMISFIIAAVAFPLFQGLTLWRGLKIGEKNFAGFAKIEMCGMILTQLGIIAVTQFYGGQYVGVFLVFVIAPILINLLMLYWLRHFLRDTGPVEDGIVPHGLESSFYGAFSVFANYFDKLMLFFFLTPASLAIFAAADRFIELLRTAVQDVATSLAPKFANVDTYSKKLHTFFLIFSFLFGLLIIIFAITILPSLILFVYGENYADAIPYAQILSISVMFGSVASLQFRYIRSKLDTKSFRNIMVYSSLLRIIVSLILIPNFGISGAVASVILFRFMISGIIGHTISKKYLI